MAKNVGGNAQKRDIEQDKYQHRGRQDADDLFRKPGENSRRGLLRRVIIHNSRPRRRAKTMGSVARLRLLQGPHAKVMLLIQFDPPLLNGWMWSAW